MEGLQGSPWGALEAGPGNRTTVSHLEAKPRPFCPPRASHVLLAWVRPEFLSPRRNSDEEALHGRAGAADVMTEPWGRLRIDVVDDEIIVSLPGTSYSVTYFKRANSPQLLAGASHIQMMCALARAWRVANERARELGWIV
jgi:hypothetical protein